MRGLDAMEHSGRIEPPLEVQEVCCEGLQTYQVEEHRSDARVVCAVMELGRVRVVKSLGDWIRVQIQLQVQDWLGK